jgi:hypothetical protein
MILIELIRLIGLLTVDPKDRLKMSDLSNSEWVRECSVKQQPSTLHMTLDILAQSAETGVKQTFCPLNRAPQEGFRVRVSSVISFCLFYFYL